MNEVAEIERTLSELAASGQVEVYEDGEWLGDLSSLRYELRSDPMHVVIHLWSEERHLARRVLRIAKQSADRTILEVQRFGQTKPGKLEFVCAGLPVRVNRAAREKFCARFRQMLVEQFSDERIDSLTISPDLEHSFSGCYARGALRRGRRAWAVIGVSAAEDAATVDSVLSFGLLWLDWTREHAKGSVVEGLRVFVPAGSSRVTAHRLQALAPRVNVELYELDGAIWRARRIDPRDAGNLATWLTPRRQVEHTLAAARETLEKVCALAPEAIDAVVPPGTREVALRFRGLEFARWRNGHLFFGLAHHRSELTEQNWNLLEKLVMQLGTYRHPLAHHTNHPLYRAQAERWLETLVLSDPMRLDARLDPRHLYPQLPAFSAGDRAVIDLLGVTRGARLAVIELKAAEDIHLALQAVDYWLRVRWHHQQGDFPRYGYFHAIELQSSPPLLYLVAPGFRFHAATDTILRYLSPELEVVRIGLNENWRRGLRVTFRQ
jgi:hypothetical protein